jgi:hypothetical protein
LRCPDFLRSNRDLNGKLPAIVPTTTKLTRISMKNNQQQLLAPIHCYSIRELLGFEEEQSSPNEINRSENNLI